MYDVWKYVNKHYRLHTCNDDVGLEYFDNTCHCWVECLLSKDVLDEIIDEAQLVARNVRFKH